MFTGIIEEKSNILQALPKESAIEVIVGKPQSFDDIKPGDSIACSGVCLTVEKFDDSTMTFTIGFETLKITGWDPLALEGKVLNLERSLKFGDRIHGHLVSGHVDTQTELVQKEWAGDCLLLSFKLPAKQKREIWKKSSVTLDGVSLTVNEVENDEFQVCLIPETLRKTQLQEIEVGTFVNLETDYYMKGFLNSKDVENA